MFCLVENIAAQLSNVPPQHNKYPLRCPTHIPSHKSLIVRPLDIHSLLKYKAETDIDKYIHVVQT